MIELNLPKAEFKIRTEDTKKYIFDCLRKKYVKLTPEEYVRQNIINFLITSKGYPKGLLANEVSIKFNKLTYRCDSVLYNSELQPLMIMEYKAPHIEITNEVLKQIYYYNRVLKVKYLLLSNGICHYCLKLDYLENKLYNLDKIPNYEELLIE